jgi:hypothetical protein
VTFVAHQNPTKVLYPPDGAFDAVTPFVAAEPAAILGRRFSAVRAMRTNELNSATQEARPQRIAVRRQIVQQMFRQAMQLPLLQERFDQRDFVRAGTGDVSTPRQPLVIDQQEEFGAFAAFGLADACAPFFAAQNVPSAMDSVVSRTPDRSRRCSKRDQAFSKIPLFVHSWWRRQQVLPEGKGSGTSSQRAPVRRTQHTPSKQARAGAGCRPPLDDRGRSGNKSAINDHCSSVSSNLGSVVDPAAALGACHLRDRPISDLLSTSLTTQQLLRAFS